jgi:lipid II:glycine glycyltransferase (peptidoglycan interpeptide bridge formation enzyme)
LELFADANIYQTWSYGSVRWGDGHLSHLVLKQDGEVAALAQLRIIHVPLLGRGVAYIRWGPVCRRWEKELDAEVVERMATALHEEYARKRKLFLRILPNTFIGSPQEQLLRSAFSQYSNKSGNGTDGGRTFLVDLAPPLEELRKRLDQKWRNRLNRAEKNGLKLAEGQGAGEYRVFSRIYKEMMARKKFDTTVDVDEFERIQESLAENERMKVLICSQDDTPVGGIVCSVIGDMGIYLLGATNDAGLDSQGAYLLQWTMIRWLKENGFRHYDLGGIDPERNPGVYHFKQGLSGQDVSRTGPLESCEDLLSSIGMKLADFV